ncbi:hypothetical protein JI664_12620 [Rhodobacter sp. NTK016B]|uniref:hypothetical protein n=1 Tax=Rhodobacter sp. NTK016B TaxID=2759676 RepID=UPI001A8DFB1C|nr:hypothetical protein [Rhodobacter sp. NTK016B]MBN8292810.1 hypothetical protein [Rhodobacter sp. NTK016B]
MAYAKHNFAAAENQGKQVSRRQLLSAAPAAGLAAMMTGAVPVPAPAETPVPADDWMAEIMAHVECILELLNDSSPDDVSITGFEFRCDSNGLIPEGVWATGHRWSDENPGLRGLVHARPGIASPWRGNGEYI